MCRVQHLSFDSFRYYQDNDTLITDEGFYQTIRGFVNMTAVKNSPVFLSFPHMMFAEEKWRKRIQGMSEPDYKRDSTEVHIEPMLGKGNSIQSISHRHQLSK